MPKDWIQTATGRHYPVLEPHPDNIDIRDIAWALSLQCRYNGHVKRHYSVAEHSILVSYMVPQEDALWGLLHDASETYLGDVVRPLKHTDVMQPYRELEERTMRAVAERFGLKWPEPPEVSRADHAILCFEGRLLLDAHTRDWDVYNNPELERSYREGPAGQRIIEALRKDKTPRVVYESFLKRWRELQP